MSKLFYVDNWYLLLFSLGCFFCGMSATGSGYYGLASILCFGFAILYSRKVLPDDEQNND